MDGNNTEDDNPQLLLEAPYQLNEAIISYKINTHVSGYSRVYRLMLLTLSGVCRGRLMSKSL